MKIPLQSIKLDATETAQTTSRENNLLANVYYKCILNVYVLHLYYWSVRYPTYLYIHDAEMIHVLLFENQRVWKQS